MCGIAGFVDLAAATGREQGEAIGQAMADALAHRGPDDSGTWMDPASGVCLAHRRLSIIDLSAAGHQPMASPSGRFTVTYNGEIYNHETLRRELGGLGYAFRGHCDTEVLVNAVDAWGIERTLSAVRGMFALVLWDRDEQALILARDRLGEKPLYYGYGAGCLLFGSELKALARHPGWQGEVDRDALALFLRHNYIPAPHSIYRGVFKLPPATWLRLPLERLRRREPLVPAQGSGEGPRPRQYWRLAPDPARNGPGGGGDEGLLERMRAAVREQMIADVPLGALLSGGIDSSLVVALMQEVADAPVHTFTVGQQDPEYDESAHGSRIASHLGTHHTALEVSPRDAIELIPALPHLYDEPFSDPSQIPTALVFREARQKVKVVLSGDAGDELFGGYDRYRVALSLQRRMDAMPPALRRAAASLLASLPRGLATALVRHGARLGGVRLRRESAVVHLERLLDLLATRSRRALYRDLVSHWKEPASIVIGASEPETLLAAQPRPPCPEDYLEEMMYLDTLTYLPDDILVKVDRASMAVGLEVRVPMLDYRVVEQAWRMPLAERAGRGGGKAALRRLLSRYVPRKQFERPKQGFAVPLGHWLRGDLREWAETLLDERRLREEGYLRPEPVRRRWQQHLAGTSDWQYYLWDVLMFQAWHEAAACRHASP